MENAWYIDFVEDGDEDVLVNEYDITSIPNDFNMLTLFNFIESGIVKIPDFQRNYVWDQKRASKLIESIILGLPVPQVFFYESEKNNYLVIDGQQRLMSIYFFMKQRFPKTTARNLIRTEFETYGKIRDEVIQNDEYFVNFNLKLNYNGNISAYNGFKYSTLDEKIKNQFNHMRTMRSIIIKQNSPDDSDSSMFEIFNRLNTGGLNLTAQEIRASLYYSPFYSMLYRINENEKWRALLLKPEQDAHAKDIEFIIRGFMLMAYGDNYKPSMTNSLNKFSKEVKSFSIEAIDYFEKLFVSFLDSCDSLPDGAFCTNNRFNVSKFDAVFAAVCEPFYRENTFVAGKISPESFEQLSKDTSFLESVQSSTASKKSVDTRILLAKRIIVLDI